MFLSRFPSLSSHKAWERHKEEADVGPRGSLGLFWQSKGHRSMTHYLSRIFLAGAPCAYFELYVKLHWAGQWRAGGGYCLGTVPASMTGRAIRRWWCTELFLLVLKTTGKTLLLWHCWILSVRVCQLVWPGSSQDGLKWQLSCAYCRVVRLQLRET